jgi:hypothetical protein
MVSNTTQHPPPPPSHTLSVYTVLYFEFGKGGGRQVNQKEGERSNSSQSWVENTNMTDCISNL